jgi:hypothetical protein
MYPKKVHGSFSYEKKGSNVEVDVAAIKNEKKACCKRKKK